MLMIDLQRHRAALPDHHARQHGFVGPYSRPSGGNSRGDRLEDHGLLRDIHGDVNHHQRIDLVSGEERRDGLAIVVWACRGDHIHRIAQAGLRRQACCEWAFVASDNSGTIRPPASQVSAQRMPGPPALVRIATRRPFGSGWLPRAAARSNISASVSARITPVWRKRASTATSLAASAAVCEPAARLPAHVRPLFITTIGLRRLTRRAMRAKRRGLPKDSRYRDHVGVLIFLPVLQEVVAGDVRLIPHADEGR